MKWLKRVALAVVLVFFALVIAGGWYASRVLPRTDGTLALAGAQAALTIERDSHGIPTIRASSAHDAYFGLGVAHAQTAVAKETHRASRRPAGEASAPAMAPTLLAVRGVRPPRSAIRSAAGGVEAALQPTTTESRGDCAAAGAAARIRNLGIDHERGSRSQIGWAIMMPGISRQRPRTVARRLA